MQLVTKIGKFFKVDKLRHIIPKSSLEKEMDPERARMTMQDKEREYQTKVARHEMKKLIKKLRKRDTRENIRQLRGELEELRGGRQCSSMYKIKQQMD